MGNGTGTAQHVLIHLGMKHPMRDLFQSRNIVHLFKSQAIVYIRLFVYFRQPNQKEQIMNIGDKAPEVLGINEKGEEILLSNYQGKKVVLYFYPKDNTSGCTAEACSLRDNYAELKAKGYEVIGVSVDNEKSHQKFIEKYELPFTLIADTDKKLVEAMGVWGEKSMYGRKYMGTFRTTFILNEEGVVEQIFLPKEIKTKTHGEQILAKIN